jgi:hypothetical protein
MRFASPRRLRKLLKIDQETGIGTALRWHPEGCTPRARRSILADPRMQKAARDMSERLGILNADYQALRTSTSNLLERIEAALKT